MTDCRGDDQDAADAAAQDARVVIHLAIMTGAGHAITAVVPGKRVSPIPVTEAKANGSMAVARLDMEAALALQERLQRVTGHYPTGTGAAVDHDCSSCGASLARCDTRIRNGRAACCPTCTMNDTHQDTPSGYAERERARMLARAYEGHADAIEAHRSPR